MKCRHIIVTFTHLRDFNTKRHDAPGSRSLLRGRKFTVEMGQFGPSILIFARTASGDFEGCAPKSKLDLVLKNIGIRFGCAEFSDGGSI